MDKNQILEAAEKAFEMFPHSIDKPIFEVMGKAKFLKYLKDSALDVNVKKTPAFVAHLPDGELVVFCKSIIDELVGKKSDNYKKKFVAAVTVHELFHVWNKHRCISTQEALLSEEEVHGEVEKEFPDLAKVLRAFK